MKREPFFGVKGAIVLICIFVFSTISWGATFTVTTTADSGPGSLRDAILQANAVPGADIINFAVPGAGPHTIFPITALPPLTDPLGVSIDGSTQPGAFVHVLPSMNVIMIEIDGSNTGPAIGLHSLSDNNSIICLAVSNFEQDGIRIEGGIANQSASFNLIEYCFVGTDPTGTIPKGNGRNLLALWAGIAIQNVANGIANNNTVQSCLISANYAEGVHITGPIQPGQVQGNDVLLCYIGTDVNALSDMGNLHEGVCLSEGTILNRITQNIVSGNDYDGVGMQGFDNEQYMAPPIYTSSNYVAENIIGLDINLNPLPNSMHGVAIGVYGPSYWGCAPNNKVYSNIIAENGLDGVTIWEHPIDAFNADQNEITQNNIYENGGLGIDHQDNSVTPNDLGDPDEGPNIYINYPVITSAIITAGTTTITGTVDIDSDPTQGYVEIFYVGIPDPTGYGEGDLYIGTATPDAAGNWSFVTTSLVVGDYVSSTMTDAARNTSEFSSAMMVNEDNPSTGACCLPDGSCIITTSGNCAQQGGQYFGDGSVCLGDNNGNQIDDLCEEPADLTCEYYKAPYPDYAPNGMPDFDQKQGTWFDPTSGMWTHCGPVALANCFWWFDSKFETNTIPPPAIIDNYPLVSSFYPPGAPAWDDHDAQNVVPLVDSMALYCNTNPPGGSGTHVLDLATGALNWLTKLGLQNDYTVRPLPIDGAALDFEMIREEVLASQDVIILLGFYEEVDEGICERIGGHYVTTAGICTAPEDSAICISDPFYDRNEGEPPAGSAHGATIHNDAANVSGPHGTIDHDRYEVIPATCQFPTGMPFQLELQNYPVSSSDIMQFFGQNHYDPAIPQTPPQGNAIHTIMEWAVIICPVEEDTCDVQLPGDANSDGVIDIGDVTYLTSYIYLGGPPPPMLANGDVNGDCAIDLRDVMCLTRHLNGIESCIVDCTCQNPDVSNLTYCCYGMRGNVNYDMLDQLDISDLLYLVDYFFLSPPGPAPPCMEEADVNGSTPMDISDLLYLVDYFFLNPPGPAPTMCP